MCQEPPNAIATQSQVLGTALPRSLLESLLSGPAPHLLKQNPLLHFSKISQVIHIQVSLKSVAPYARWKGGCCTTYGDENKKHGF